jgi:lysyl-tRNA synthetase class 2|nr:lysine--tRNA ligase [Kofleriaceae bacterium]
MADDASDPHSTLERIIGERRAKAAALHAAGAHPYRNDIRPTISLADLRARYDATKPAAPEPGAAAARTPITAIDGETFRVAGRAMIKRGMGKTVFVPLRDGTGDLQLYLNVDHLAADDFATQLPQLDAGDIVAAEGPVFWTRTGELSVLAKRFWIVTKSLRPLPDKHAGLTDVEARYRQRYVDLATNPEVRDVFRKRVQIVRGIRSFLDARGFLEVETPMMHPIIGGAAARPFVTHHNALDMPLFLRIAPELYLKRLVVGGFERVYEINRNFRNEGLSRQHNPEFTMLELYQAYAVFTDLIDMTESLVASLAREVTGGSTVAWDGVEVELAAPWRRLAIRDAVRELGGVDNAAQVFEDPVVAAEVAVRHGVKPAEVVHVLMSRLDDATGLDADALAKGGIAVAAKVIERYSKDERRVIAGHLGYLVFEATAESKLVQPTFLTEFPLAVSPLARKNDHDPAFCDRFELFVCGKEIANGFSELNDPDDQRSRFAAQVRAKSAGAGETMDYDEDYCRALEVGMPPTAGEGIGIDRLVMMLTGQPSIRDVLLFPLMRAE